jgi:hypothetical protein
MGGFTIYPRRERLIKNAQSLISSSRFSELITEEEVVASVERLDDLLNTDLFPLPSEEWPPIPWPPF